MNFPSEYPIMVTLQEVFDKIKDSGCFGDAVIDSVNSERSTGDSALHIVTIWGDVDAVNVLVANGADVNKPGEEGYTPLHYAAEQNQIDVAKVLIRAGATRCVERHGYSPSVLAKLNGNVELYGLLSSASL